MEYKLTLIVHILSTNSRFRSLNLQFKSIRSNSGLTIRQLQLTIWISGKQTFFKNYQSEYSTISTSSFKLKLAPLLALKDSYNLKHGHKLE